ncbi:MAG: amidase family protein, partial [Patescibacteria group bacterium]
ITEKEALELAKSADNLASQGEAWEAKPLLGIPIALKDLYSTKGIKTTAASKVLEDYIPLYDATVVRKLKEAGAIIVGKTNLDAWAHGSSTETSQYGRTLNPRNPEHLPGGSSGGSAAAISADLCICAIGSETAGSIRQPAAWCGCVGLKPTYGRVSRYGVVAMGSSLDCPGPIGKTVEDTAILFEAIAGKDSHDATTGIQEVPNLSKSLNRGVKGFRVGICYIDHLKIHGTPAAFAVEEAGKVLEKLGANVELVPLSDSLEKNKILTPDYAIGVYTVVQRSEVSSNLARYDGVRYGNDRSFFGEEAKQRIMLGTFTLTAGYADKYYLKALQVRTIYMQNYAQLFEKFDVLISPTSPGYALKVGASKDNPMFGELEDMLLEGSSITGLPGINVPMFHDPKTNLYLGLNIIASQWQEEKIVRAAYAFEQATKWNSWVNNKV